MLIAGCDIETTGLDQAAGHRIIEIALIFYDLETQAEKGRYVRRINPDRPIDPKAQAVHGISFTDLVGMPHWEAIGPQVAALLSKPAAIVAHNGIEFDLPFINGELARIGQPVCTAPVVDTMVQGRWATPLGKVPNLGEICFACGVDYDPNAAHAADYDVEVMMKAFFHAYNKGFVTIPESRRAA